MELDLDLEQPTGARRVVEVTDGGLDCVRSEALVAAPPVRETSSPPASNRASGRIARARPTTPLARLFLRMLWNRIAGAAPGRGLDASPEAYGMRSCEPATRRRTEGILQAYFTGVDASLRGASCSRAVADTVEPLLQPFYWEGAVMAGETLGALPFYRYARVEQRALGTDEAFAHLRVVGVGLAIGTFLPNKQRRLEKAAQCFGNLGPLVHDGYGFALGLVSENLENAVRGLDGLTGFARRSALSGVGRSLWLQHLDRPAAGIEEAKRSAGAFDLLGGMGLAAAFTFPDDLGRSYSVAESLRGDEQRAFVKGIRLALLIRELCDRRHLDDLLSASAREVEERARKDLGIARKIHLESLQHPEYIRRLHEGCNRAT
jgi:hypothetical protein